MTVTDDPQGLDHPAGGADVLREAAERIADLGPAALTDVELTAILLGSAEIAQRLCGCVNIRRLHEVPDEDLAAVRGVGPDRVRKLLAAAEIGRRLWNATDPLPLIRGPEQVYEHCRDIRSTTREHFVAFYLNSRHQILRREVISIGSLNASIVHPREVFRPAIVLCAASLVLAHNHPSGDTQPSEEDLAITRRLHEAGRLLGIELVDHVVVADSGYTSFRERRLLK
jgi:DNA repair protein RadC